MSSLPHFAIPSSLMGNAVQPLKFVNAHVSRDQPILHEKVRRIQSENDCLSFKDRLESKKNGLLTHQQSAPLFPFVTPQGSVIQTPRLAAGLRPSLFPVPGPPMMVNFDQKHGEAQTQLKINQKVSEEKEREAVEQNLYQTNLELAPPTRSGKEEKGFEKKKSKFIREAMQWSKKLENKLVVKPEIVVKSDQLSENMLKSSSAHSQQPLVSPQQTSPHSPIISSQKQLPTFLMGNPQTCGMYTLLPQAPALSSLAGGVLPTQVPLLTAMQPLSGTNQSPNDGSRPLSCVLPHAIPVTTPTLSTEQKFVYMMQDGTLIATPILQQERQEVGASRDAINRMDNSDAASTPPARSPKRTGSPNSDTDIMTYSARKRRRSSSLPGVSNHRSPSSDSESSPSPTTPPPGPPTLYPITSPSDIKMETHLLTLPQITSPSTGHYTPNLFFSGMQMSANLASSDLTRMKMDGDVSNEDKGIENDTGHPSSPDNHVHPGNLLTF